MALYRKIEVRMFSDAKFRALSRPNPCGQYLWFYLLAGPHTTSLPGLFNASEAGIADGLGWSVEDFREAFAEVSRQGMAEADWKARFVYLPSVFRQNVPQSPNVVKSWARHMELLMECELRDVALASVKAGCFELGEAYGKAFEEAFAEAFPKGLSIGMPNSGTGTGTVSGSEKNTSVAAQRAMGKPSHACETTSVTEPVQMTFALSAAPPVARPAVPPVQAPGVTSAAMPPESDPRLSVPPVMTTGSAAMPRPESPALSVLHRLPWDQLTVRQVQDRLGSGWQAFEMIWDAYPEMARRKGKMKFAAREWVAAGLSMADVYRVKSKMLDDNRPPNKRPRLDEFLRTHFSREVAA